MFKIKIYKKINIACKQEINYAQYSEPVQMKLITNFPNDSLLVFHFIRLYFKYFFRTFRITLPMKFFIFNWILL